MMNTFFVPGQIVVHPQCPDWGFGQIQSVADNRVTVNFQNSGKVLIDVSRVSLDIISSPNNAL